MSGEISLFQRANSASTERDDDDDEEDWNIPLAFSGEKHTEKIEGLEDIAQTWRLKDRVTFLNSIFDPKVCLIFLFTL